MEDQQLAHLFNTNIALSPRDVAYARNLISKEESILKTLENDISQLQPEQRLNDLIVQRGVSRARVKSYRSLTTIVRRIPPDILAEIFTRYHELAVALSPRWLGPPDFRDISPISHVCSLWRQVAISTAHLWTSVSFRLTAENPHHLTEQLSTLWKRTHDMPLELCVRLCGPQKISPVQIQPAKFPPQAEHLQILSLSSIPTYAINHILDGVRLSRLEHLSIDLTRSEADKHWEYNRTDASPVLLFDPAELVNLRQFALYLEGFSDVGINLCNVIELPWQQLTSLDILGGGAFRPGLLQILECCVNLEECRLKLDEPLGFGQEVFFSTPSMVDLPRLRELSITADMGADDFLEGLCLPALKMLEITVETDLSIPWSERRVLKSLQQRSNFQLESLLLRDFGLTWDELLDFVSAQPSLVTISICNYMGSGLLNFVEFLTYDPSNPQKAAPKLESLTAYYQSPLVVYAEDTGDSGRLAASVAAMVKSRWRPPSIFLGDDDRHGVACLKKLSLHAFPHGPEVRQRLEECCSEGFLFEWLEGR